MVYYVQRRMSLLNGLSTVLVGTSIDGIISEHLLGEVEPIGAKVELVLAEFSVIEAILSGLSKTLSKWSLGLDAGDKASIAWDNTVLWCLWLLRRI